MERNVLKASAKDALQHNWGNAILVLFIQSALMSATAGVTGIGPIIIGGPLSVGVALFFLKLSYRDKAQIEDLFQPFHNFVNTFFAGFLVGLFTFLWSLLFIVPGIVKGLAYSQTFFIINENPELTGKQAIDASQEMMRGHKGELFGLDLSFLGWYLLGAFPVLGYAVQLWSRPYIATTKTLYYEHLLAQSGYFRRTEAAPEQGRDDTL